MTHYEPSIDIAGEERLRRNSGITPPTPLPSPLEYVLDQTSSAGRERSTWTTGEADRRLDRPCRFLVHDPRESTLAREYFVYMWARAGEYRPDGRSEYGRLAIDRSASSYDEICRRDGHGTIHYAIENVY